MIAGRHPPTTRLTRPARPHSPGGAFLWRDVAAGARSVPRPPGSAVLGQRRASHLAPARESSRSEIPGRAVGWSGMQVAARRGDGCRTDRTHHDGPHKAAHLISATRSGSLGTAALARPHPDTAKGPALRTRCRAFSSELSTLAAGACSASRPSLGSPRP